ncbi:MAG TPA: hypothetical protein VKV17_07615 [Bryobacteraceae bacterium]|nr:hypothetical protein [Bryobacteraceae bacterium]
MSGAHQTEDDRDWTANARSRLARRRAEKPSTKAAQIRALWPDIEAALGVGQSMKTICAWLAEDAGITVSVTSLTSYVSRIRRRENTTPDPERVTAPSARVQLRSSPTAPEPVSAIVRTETPIRNSDPLANYRASAAKRPGFNYRPATPEDEKNLF